eukprot:3687712-Amphidinium_carterae.1
MTYDIVCGCPHHQAQARDDALARSARTSAVRHRLSSSDLSHGVDVRAGMFLGKVKIQTCVKMSRIDACARRGNSPS